MVKLTVEPPEYYPVVDKFFANGLVEALEALGVETTDIKAGVKAVKNQIRIGFIIEVVKPEAFSINELEVIISTILEKLSEEATKSMGRFYNATFEVAGFKVIKSSRSPENTEIRVIVNAPEDLRRNLERLGKGLAIYLKDRGIDFSTLVINVPKDGRPRAITTVLLRRPMHPLEKEHISESILEKTRSYLRTLNLEYLGTDVKVLDPTDKKVSLILKEKNHAEKLASDITKDETVKEILKVFGRKIPEL